MSRYRAGVGRVLRTPSTASCRLLHSALLSAATVRITRSNPGSIPPGTQGVVCQHAPDGRPRRRTLLAREAAGDFNCQFTQAVATQRHLASGRTFARQRDHQRARRGWDRLRSTTARLIVQPSTAFGGEPAQPAAGSGPAHPLLARQRPTAQSSGATQDQTRVVPDAVAWCQRAPSRSIW